MSSGWSAYYPILIAALLGLMVPGVVWFFTRPLRSASLRLAKQRDRDGITAPPPDRARLGLKANTRYFLGASLGLVLSAFALLLIPVSSILKSAHSEAGLISIISIGSLAGLALSYAARKGDLNWLRAYQRAKTEGSK